MAPSSPAAPSAPPPSRPWYELPHAPQAGCVLGDMAALEDGQVLLCHPPPATATAPAPNAPPAPPFSVLLLRSGTEVKAFANRCTHFGMPLAVKQEHLLFKPHTSITCNVHYARFSWADGSCEFGECAGEGLSPIPIEIDASGQIRIAAAAL